MRKITRIQKACDKREREEKCHAETIMSEEPTTIFIEMIQFFNNLQEA